jgi:hypothetical protein
LWRNGGEGFRGNQKEGAGRGRGSGQSPTAWATRARKGRGTWDRSAGLGVAGDHRSPPVTIDACLSPNVPGRYVHLNRQTQTVGPLGPRKRRFLPPMLGDPHPSEAPDRPGGDLVARPKARAFVAQSAHSSKTKRHSKGVRGEEVGRSVLGTGMVGWSDKEERERRTAAQRAGGRGAFGERRDLGGAGRPAVYIRIGHRQDDRRARGYSVSAWKGHHQCTETENDDR